MATKKNPFAIASVPSALRWDARAGQLRYIDTRSDRIQACEPDGPVTLIGRLQETALSIADCASGRLLLGMSKRLYLAAYPQQGAPRAEHLQGRVLAAIDPLDPRIMIADGRTDRDGGFVFGTANLASDRRAIGSFFQFSARGGLRRLALPTVVAASCICFSIDGTRLFFADAAAGTLYTCSYNAASSTVADVQPFAESVIPGSIMRGAFVDRGGNVWTAQVSPSGHSVIVQYDASGRVIQRVPFPGQLACISPGGHEHNRLFALTSSAHLHEIGDIALAGHGDEPFNDNTYPTDILSRHANPAPPGIVIAGGLNRQLVMETSLQGSDPGDDCAS